jgi:hypothetical protein
MDQPSRRVKATRFGVENYPRTGRKKVSMMVHQNGGCKVDQPYLPVWREEGKYFQNSDRKYCGTFYYYEPDSPYFLNLGQSLIAGSKIDAILQLEGREDFKEASGNLSLSNARIAILSFINQFYPDRLPKGWEAEIVRLREGGQPSESFETALNRVFRTREGERILKDIDQLARLSSIEDLEKHRVTIPRYTSSGTREEATLDAMYNVTTKRGTQYLGNQFMVIYRQLDQLICNLAREQGYDTVILQREPSETEVNTEIIDTREREDSYHNICTEIFNLVEPDPRFPRIWFPDYGFMQYEPKENLRP